MLWQDVFQVSCQQPSRWQKSKRKRRLNISSIQRKQKGPLGSQKHQRRACRLRKPNETEKEISYYEHKCASFCMPPKDYGACATVH